MAGIHLSSEGNKTHHAQKRQIGKYNWGLYCANCQEFFALAVTNEVPAESIEFLADGEPLFECPFCHHRQRRQVSEIAFLFLTDAMKRKPPIPPNVH